MYDDSDTDDLTFWLRLSERGKTTWFFQFVKNMNRLHYAFA